MVGEVHEEVDRRPEVEGVVGRRGALRLNKQNSTNITPRILLIAAAHVVTVQHALHAHTPPTPPPFGHHAWRDGAAWCGTYSRPPRTDTGPAASRSLPRTAPGATPHTATPPPPSPFPPSLRSSPPPAPRSPRLCTADCARSTWPAPDRCRRPEDSSSSRPRGAFPREGKPPARRWR